MSDNLTESTIGYAVSPVR